MKVNIAFTKNGLHFLMEVLKERISHVHWSEVICVFYHINYANYNLIDNS